MVLTDDATDPNLYPSRANILAQMRALVAGAAPGDSLFFSFSGHGSQVKDTSGDEADGMDETICPADYTSAGDARRTLTEARAHAPSHSDARIVSCS